MVMMMICQLECIKHVLFKILWKVVCLILHLLILMKLFLYRLLKFLQIKLEPKDKFEEYSKYVNPPIEIKEICSDLKVLGKREMKILVKWKTKIQKKIEKLQNVEVDEDEKVLSSDEELTRKILK